jgi:hypothetical protein
MKAAAYVLYAFGTCAIGALLAGCGRGLPASVPTTSAPSSGSGAGGAGASPASGIYVLSESSSPGQAVFGYPTKNRDDKPPICVVSGVPTAAGLGVDESGNLLVGINGSSVNIKIFGGPHMCGPLVGSFADPYGQPDDIASREAMHGKIAVANVFDGSPKRLSPGSISVCAMAGGCTTNLTNPSMNEVFGVAMDSHGNCWASADNASKTATLTYFKKCMGAGQSSTGFSNPYPGGLDFDAAGNLVSMSFHNAAVYVYRGCKPACTKIAGPLALRGPTTYAHLNKRSTELIAADFYDLQIDVYAYTPTKLTFKYDFANGVSGRFLDGVAVNPPSKR